MKCTATASACVCGLQLHTDDVPHECGEINVTNPTDGDCGCSWYGDSIEDERFEVVRFPSFYGDGGATGQALYDAVTRELES